MRLPPSLLLATLLAACAEAGREEPPESASAPDTQVAVWFSRGEAPVAVERRVPEPTPEAALSALLAGPSEAERTAGVGSWFSAETADALAGVESRDGFLVVGFSGLSQRIPGAGSSAGSAQLLAALDSTVFQFPDVDSVEYRLDGSCEAFWGWLQRECRVVKRP
ncbi:MAG TPA: GerMN domain-containing protein [Longimicrobiales bacterium]|nr:GerMN domain-containing protein [Longimicrobiales bacterium]